MIRKGIAVMLLWLMSVTIVTSQPALHFCLCLDTVFLEGCPCPASGKAVESRSCGCDSDLSDCETPAPSCGECSIDLVYEMGDFVCTSAHDSGLAKTDLDPPAFSSPDLNTFPKARFRASIHGIRGGPPPPLIFSAGPLRLRYSVFLV